MKKLIATLLSGLFLASALFSQKSFLTESPQTLAGRLQDAEQRLDPLNPAASLLETLDAAFDSITGQTSIKGFNAAIRLPDGSYWKRASGVSQTQPLSMPLTTEHLMGMGSISKTFVSATLLLLVEEGLLSLDDQIGEHLTNDYPNIGDSITVRQLLNHRSGLNDYLNENPASTAAWGNDMNKIWTFDDILNGYVLAPNFAPDSSWSYSNTNFVLAGLLIEEVTGQPWYEVLRQKVLDPLELTHTFTFPWEPLGSQDMSHVFADLIGNGNVQDFQGFGLPVEGLFSLATSAGCLVTTPEDLAKFTERLFAGHLLQPATLAEMETDYIQDGSGFIYGLGAASFPVPQNLDNWGHNGNLIYKSFALYFPTENMSLAVQQNDDRLHDPGDANSPKYDLNDIFLVLLETYLNYTPPSATGETAHGDSLLLFPNPAGSQVLVHSSTGQGEAALYDLQGHLLQLQRLDNKRAITFDLSSLPAGSYLVRMGGAAKLLVKE